MFSHVSVHPSICLSAGGGTPVKSSPGGIPWPGPDMGYPSQGGHLPGVPPPHCWPGQDGGYPSQGCPPGVSPGQVRMGVPQPGGYPSQGPPPGQVKMGGYPPQYKPPPPGSGWGGGTPGTGQHMEYLINGGRYASCVDAGGLSCLMAFFTLSYPDSDANHLETNLDFDSQLVSIVTLSVSSTVNKP